MERREKKRHPRRVQIRFFREGDTEPRSGYTINLSSTGMFIGTNSPLPLGTKVKVEFVEPDPGFAVVGEVAHAARVSPLLRRVRPSGMGVRFVQRYETLVETLQAQRGL